MKKNGFTLIEVLGVISLLALLSIIVIISVDIALKQTVDTLSEAQIANIKSAAEMWRTDNIDLIPENGTYVINLNQLISEGYIEPVIDPKTNEEYNRNIYIDISMNEISVDID